MPPEILDDFRPEKPTNYGAKSLRHFLKTIACFAPLLIFSVVKFYFPEIAPLGGAFGMIALFGFGFSIAGFWKGCKSFYYQESSYKKYVGLLGNFVFVAILLLIFYANFLDLLRWFDT